MRVDPRGVTGPTRGQANGPRWRRTSYGFYVPIGVDVDLPEQRVLEQSVRLPPGGAVTGWGGCRLDTANFFDGLEADRRITVSRERLAAEEIVVRHGIPCTRTRRALFDEMRRADDVRESVVAVDMMAAAQRVSIRRMLATIGPAGGASDRCTPRSRWPASAVGHRTRPGHG